MIKENAPHLFELDDEPIEEDFYEKNNQSSKFKEIIIN
jgi:hypothetical protein